MLISTGYRISFILISILFVSLGCTRKSDEKVSDHRVKFKNVLIVGWDGLQRSRVKQLLREHKLPNLEEFIKRGSYLNLDISEAGPTDNPHPRKTETKPGWAQIFTGYLSDDVGVKSNVDYRPIPEGYTVFERLKKKFGAEGIKTYFIGGKNVNIGARGPHEVCLNCRSRHADTLIKTKWWENAKGAPLKKGESSRNVVPREGSPFYNAKKSLDIHRVALGKNINVGIIGIGAIKEMSKQRFFTFLHFEEPDEVGHLYGEFSKEYSQSIIENDAIFGKLLMELAINKVRENTVVFLLSDHGLTAGTKNHRYAPKTIMASNIRNLKATADRLDIAPTIYDLYGMDLEGIEPALVGNSLLTKDSILSFDRPKSLSDKIKSLDTLNVGYFHGGRTSALFRANVSGFFHREALNVGLYTRDLNDPKYYRMSDSYYDMFLGAKISKATGDQLTDEMLSGSVQAATIGETAFLKQVGKGRDIVAIAELGYDTKEMPGHGILLRTGVKVKSNKDFRKLKMVSRRSSGGDDIFLKEFLTNIGIDPEEMNLELNINEDVLKKKMVSGEADGGFYHLISIGKMGRSKLGYVHRKFDWVNPEMSQAILIVSREYLKSHRGLLKQMIRGYMKRVRYEHSMPLKFKTTLSAMGPIQRGIDMALDASGMNLPQYRKIPTIREPLLAEMQKLALKYKVLKKEISLEKYIDNSLVEEVARELYGEHR